MDAKSRIFDIAQTIVDSLDDKFLLVFGEEPESAHFLKLNGKRFGRDLELYNFMIKVMGIEQMLTYFLTEIVLPARCQKANEKLKQWGLEVYKPELHSQWIELFTPNNSFDLTLRACQL